VPSPGEAADVVDLSEMTAGTVFGPADGDDDED
jgi:hypothetical protein